MKLLIGVGPLQKDILEDYLLLTNSIYLHICPDYCLVPPKVRHKSCSEKVCKMEFGKASAPGKALRLEHLLMKDCNQSWRQEMARDHPSIYWSRSLIMLADMLLSSGYSIKLIVPKGSLKYFVLQDQSPVLLCSHFSRTFIFFQIFRDRSLIFQSLRDRHSEMDFQLVPGTWLRITRLFSVENIVYFIEL